MDMENYLDHLSDGLLDLQEMIENIFGESHMIAHHDAVEAPIVSIIIPTKDCLAFLLYLVDASTVNLKNDAVFICKN